MNELLDYIVKALVSKPGEVKIAEEEAENMVNFTLSVAPEDMGIIIGKAGQTIRAIRKLLVTRAIAENQNIRVNLTLSEVAVK